MHALCTDFIFAVALPITHPQILLVHFFITVSFPAGGYECPTSVATDLFQEIK